MSGNKKPWFETVTKSFGSTPYGMPSMSTQAVIDAARAQKQSSSNATNVDHTKQTSLNNGTWNIWCIFHLSFKNI